MSGIEVQPNVYFLSKESDTEAATSYSISFVGGGSTTETVPGSTHLLEHMLLKMLYRKYSYGDSNIFYTNAIETNGLVGPDILQLEMQGHKDDSDFMLKALWEMIDINEITEEGYHKERQLLERERREMRANIHEIANDLHRKKIYKPDSGILIYPEGTAEQIARIELHDLNQRWDFIKNNANVIFSAAGGNIPAQLIRERLKTLPRATSRLGPQYKTPSLFKDFTYKPIPVANSLINAQVTALIPLDIMDFATANVRNIIYSLLLDFPQGYLYQLLRDRDPLAYSVEGMWDHDNKGLHLSFNCNPTALRTVVRAIRGLESYEPQLENLEFIRLTASRVARQFEIRYPLAYQQVSLMADTLMKYGVIESVEERADRIRNVSPYELKKSFRNLLRNLRNMKMIVSSSNPMIMMNPLK